MGKNDVLNIEVFHAKWQRQIEKDEVLRFLKKAFLSDNQSPNSLKYAQDAIQYLITQREDKIKEQVLKEMEEEL